MQLQLVPDVGFLDNLASQALYKLPAFTADQLSSMMWSMATLGYVPGTPLLEAAAAALSRNAGLLSAKCASQALWAFARMEYRPPAALLDAVLKVRNNFSWSALLVNLLVKQVMYMAQPYLNTHAH